MRIPRPEPGLVIRYSFLCRREFDHGWEEGRKDRPCAIVVSAPAVEGGARVYVLPITHLEPADPDVAIEIPTSIKKALSLDAERSWIVLDEVNDFLWPGYDVRQIAASDPPRIDYGILPPRYFDRVREAFMTLARRRRVKRTERR